ARVRGGEGDDHIEKSTGSGEVVRRESVVEFAKNAVELGVQPVRGLCLANLLDEARQAARIGVNLADGLCQPLSLVQTRAHERRSTGFEERGDALLALESFFPNSLFFLERAKGEAQFLEHARDQVG